MKKFRKKFISLLMTTVFISASYMNIYLHKANSNSNLLSAKVTSIKRLTSSKVKFEKAYYDYTGKIGSFPIHLSIYPSSGKVVGRYFYDSYKKEIKLKGTVDSSSMRLYEYATNNKITGMFSATLNSDQNISGTWISYHKKKSYKFSLQVSDIISGSTYGKRYEVATDKSDKTIEAYTAKIQKYIIYKKKDLLADCIAFPVKVRIDGKRKSIKNKTEFIKNYDSIFNDKFYTIMSNAYTTDMFVNYSGIMFGSSDYNMWIADLSENNKPYKLMIHGINN